MTSALATAMAYLAVHGLTARFDPAEDPELEDDNLQILDAAGRDTAIHIQVSNELSPGGAYFIVGEVDGDVFRHHPQCGSLLAALELATRRLAERARLRQPCLDTA